MATGYGELSITDKRAVTRDITTKHYSKGIWGGTLSILSRDIALVLVAQQKSSTQIQELRSPHYMLSKILRTVAAFIKAMRP